ncbi:MAG: hypothetical protein OXI90_05770 [Gammaproteobacteria bacterium]|nr:hypothetical protein [Gammaproteobacteria bacterium]
MKIKFKRKELRALDKLLGELEEESESEENEKTKRLTDEDDPFPISLNRKKR